MMGIWHTIVLALFAWPLLAFGPLSNLQQEATLLQVTNRARAT